MLHRLSVTKAWMLVVLRRHAYSIGQMQILHSRAPSHGHECDFILVRSKRPVGARLHSHRGIETNPANQSKIGSKFGWCGKANQKSGRFANVPFHSHMSKKGRFSSAPLSGPAGFLRVHVSAFHLLSPSMLRNSLFLPKCLCFFFILRHKLLNFNLSEHQTHFFEIILPMFFLKFL